MSKALKQPISILGKRLREAREALNIPQDKLGVLIGLDESCSSARISRYESGIHQPPIQTLKLLAKELNVPLHYLFCEDDLMAEAVLKLSTLSKRRLSDLIENLN